MYIGDLGDFGFWLGVDDKKRTMKLCFAEKHCE